MMAWQPHWVAYATAHGRTPEEQAAHDQHADGCPRGAPFMAWVHAAWRAWAAETGRRLDGRTEADHQAFAAWLPGYQADSNTAEGGQ